ncbi:unnamed protein product [Trifolium pratense]|uniref:Uncharacterized protein n=1 Tax=Trifolium pratense TaxID=57577 RepID=A0ACB0IFP6_TRIPR|nr:unnamed protein product [Trifolium pratense]
MTITRKLLTPTFKCAKQKRKVPDLNLDFDANSDNSTSSQSESEDNYMDYSTASSSDEEDQHPTNNDNNVQDEGYSDIGDPNWDCNACGAAMWYQERKGKSTDTTTPHFQMCSNNGKFQLPLLIEPPDVLRQLLFDQNSAESKKFQQNIRIYNSMFAFTSPGMKIDNTFKKVEGHQLYGSKDKHVTEWEVCYLYLDSHQSLHNFIFMTLTMRSITECRASALPMTSPQTVQKLKEIQRGLEWHVIDWKKITPTILDLSFFLKELLMEEYTINQLFLKFQHQLSVMLIMQAAEILFWKGNLST